MTTYLLLGNLCRRHLYLKNTSSTAGVAIGYKEIYRKRTKSPFRVGETIASTGLARGMASRWLDEKQVFYCDTPDCASYRDHIQVRRSDL
jgi:hypothetical protein